MSTMTYTLLSTSERYQIERWLTDGVTIGDIADLLARAPSSGIAAPANWSLGD
jgi:IS30 family transposase